jgi:hypothetical protein
MKLKANTALHLAHAEPALMTTVVLPESWYQ